MAYQPPATASSSTSGAGGFLSGLFDFRFTRFVGPTYVRIVYTLGFVLISLVALVAFLVMISRGAGGFVAGIILVPIAWVLEVVALRVSCELFAVLFRINDNIARLAGDTGQPLTADAYPTTWTTPAQPFGQAPPPAPPTQGYPQQPPYGQPPA